MHWLGIPRDDRRANHRLCADDTERLTAGPTGFKLGKKQFGWMCYHWVEWKGVISTSRSRSTLSVLTIFRSRAQNVEEWAKGTSVMVLRCSGKSCMLSGFAAFGS